MFVMMLKPVKVNLKYQMCEVHVELSDQIQKDLLFSFVQSFLYEKLNIHDSCGVNNLHGMPGNLSDGVGDDDGGDDDGDDNDK